MKNIAFACFVLVVGGATFVVRENSVLGQQPSNDAEEIALLTRKLQLETPVNSMQNDELDRLACLLAKNNLPIPSDIPRRLLLGISKCDFSRFVVSDFINRHPERAAQELVPLLRHDDAKVRARAAAVFARFRNKSVEHVNESKDKFTKSVTAMAAESNAFIVNLRANLKDNDVAVRFSAAEALIATGLPVAGEIIPLAVAWLIDREIPVLENSRSWDSTANIFAADPETAAKIIIQNVPTSNVEARERLVRAMTLLPVSVQSSWLAKTLKSSDANLVGFALSVIQSSHTYVDLAASRVNELTLVLANPDIRLRLRAADLLIRTTGADKARLLTVLKKGLDEKEPQLRLQSTILLSQLGKAATPATDALKDRLSDTEPMVRLNAAKTLLALDAKHATVALPIVKQILANRNSIAFSEMLHYVGTLKKTALPLVPELLALARDSSNPHRLKSAEVLLMIDASRSEVALDAVQEFLRDARTMDEWNAMSVIRLLGPHAKPILPEVVKIYESSRSHKRLSWAVTIAVVDPSGENDATRSVRGIMAGRREKIGDLEELLYHLEERAGPWAKSFVPELMAILAADPRNIQVIQILRSIGPGATDALPRLRSLLESESNEVRRQSTRAIGAIELR
jgi:HEAT repeat protein